MGSGFQRELSADGPLKKNGKSAERRGKGWKFPKKRKPDPLKNAEKACRRRKIRHKAKKS